MVPVPDAVMGKPVVVSSGIVTLVTVSVVAARVLVMVQEADCPAVTVTVVQVLPV